MKKEDSASKILLQLTKTKRSDGKDEYDLMNSLGTGPEEHFAFAKLLSNSMLDDTTMVADICGALALYAKNKGLDEKEIDETFRTIKEFIRQFNEPEMKPRNVPFIYYMKSKNLKN